MNDFLDEVSCARLKGNAAALSRSSEYPEERSGTAFAAPGTCMGDGTASAAVQTPAAASVGVQPAAPFRFPITAREANQRATELIRAGTVPSTFQVKGDTKTTKARLVAAIRAGADLGMPPSTALDKIILLDGRYCLLCAGALALAQRGGLVERVERRLNGIEIPDGPGAANLLAEFTDQVTADYRIWRRGQSEPYVGRYSVRDAKRAKLWMNPNRPWWMNSPGEMLMVRATAIALRAGFQDHLGGLSILEEMRDLPPAAPAVTNTDFLADAPMGEST